MLFLVASNQWLSLSQSQRGYQEDKRLGIHFDDDDDDDDVRNRSDAMIVVSFVLKVRCRTGRIVQRNQFALCLKNVSKRMTRGKEGIGSTKRCYRRIKE